MTIILPMQRFAEPLRMTSTHSDRRGPAAGGKRRAGAQPLTPSTKGMLDGGEGTTGLRARQPCIGPFAHGDQARRAQGSRGPGDQRGEVLSPMSSATRVRDPLDQHNRRPRLPPTSRRPRGRRVPAGSLVGCRSREILAL